MKVCSVEGCQRTYRCSGYCELHYERVRRGRPLEDPPPPALTRSCEIDGCESPQTARGWCKTHYYRWRNKGAADWVRPVGYKGLHDRLRTKRGSASGFTCVDCGGQAYEWSYDGTDANQLTCPITGSSYSMDLMRYLPRCIPCHRTHDLTAKPACDVEGCGRDAKAKGLCSRHYQRMRYSQRQEAIA